MVYYHVGITFKNKPLAKGIREFSTGDIEEVYRIVLDQAFKHYTRDEVIKIDCWPLADWNPELLEYLANKKK